MTKTSELMEELAELTPRKIADKLEALGIKGHQNSTMECPIANYLNKNTNLQHSITGNYYSIWDGWERLEKDNLPKNVVKFIKKFDKGRYKGLIAND